MASIPPRPAAQRSQVSRSGQSSTSSRNSSRDLTLEDSQTIIINSHPSHEGSTTERATQSGADKSPQLRPKEEEELPKCWICFQDPSEDDPQENTPWRTPCPCALTAHEACLLDWIADKEAPTGTRRAGSQGTVTCPQCKGEIKLSRPRNLLVDVYRRLETLTNWTVIPGLAIAGSASLGLISQWHGIMSIYQIFGSEDAYQILRPLTEDIMRPMQLSDSLHAIARHWRLLFGPTLIPPILILSRTTIADGLLPIVPMVFFATRPDSLITGSGKGAWPPSAALSFALLPYLRGAYNAYYDRVWKKHELEWLNQMKPRAATEAQPEDGQGNANGGGQNDIAGLRIEDEMFEFELRIDAGWEDEENDGGNENRAQPVGNENNGNDVGENAGQGHPFHAPPVDDAAEQAAPPPNIPDNRPQQQAGGAAVPGAQPVQQRNPVIGFLSLTRSVAGALLFPTIASSMGELLRAVLPVSWVTIPLLRSRWGVHGTAAPTGILQTRWGRSLIGGCLFVVVRDAVRLYVRWKMATMQRQRRVLNYDGPRPGSSR